MNYIYIHTNITLFVGVQENIMTHLISSDNCFVLEIMISTMYNKRYVVYILKNIHLVNILCSKLQNYHYCCYY